jgi:acetyltransferase-like isoleucine patch superfamily enzyme
MDNRPLIFLGSNLAIEIFSEICAENNIEIHGIIDSDYYSNTEKLCGIPVIDSEASFSDPVKLKYYKENFNFFCAVNWLPMLDPIATRNRIKRQHLIDLIDQYELSCINIIDRRAKVSKTAKLGKGIFVAEFTTIEPNSTINDFTNIWTQSIIGHDSKIGRNCVIQRDRFMCGNVTLEDNVYLSMQVSLFKSKSVISSGTVIQECIYLRRSTRPNEVVSLNSGNLKRVKHNPSPELSLDK